MKRTIVAVGLGLTLSMTAACGSDEPTQSEVQIEDCDREDFENGEAECDGYTEEDFEEEASAEEEDDDRDKKRKPRRRR